MTEPGPDAETISPSELAEQAAHAAVIELDESSEVAEREHAAAASRASLDAARPRDPRPSEVPDPVALATEVLGNVYDEQLAKRPNLTPVALPLGTMAERVVALLSGVPGAPTYHPEDTPTERFYDRRGADTEGEGMYVPAGVIGGGMPTGPNLAVRRVGEGVALPLRESGGGPVEREFELALVNARAFALAILSACYAPEPDTLPE